MREELIEILEDYYHVKKSFNEEDIEYLTNHEKFLDIDEADIRQALEEIEKVIPKGKIFRTQTKVEKFIDDFKVDINKIRNTNLKELGLKGVLKSIYNFILKGKKIVPYIKKFLKFLLEKTLVLWDYISKKEVNVSKQTLQYKRIVQEELDEARRGWDRGDELKQADYEKAILRLTRGKGIIPTLSVPNRFKFSLLSIRYDLKILIAFIIYSLIVIRVANKNYYLELEIKVLSILFYESVFLLGNSFLVISRIKKVVEKERNLENFMWEDFRYGNGLEIAYYNIMNPSRSKGEGREVIVLDDTGDMVEVDGGSVRGQPSGGVSNPYSKQWEEIFKEFFNKHNLKIPEYIKFDTTEVHIFSIATISINDFISKQEQIENFIGKKIYKIHKEYDGGIGKIGIEFETEELPRIITYNQVPNSKDTEIILGKSIKEWITWDLNTIPHSLVVGATGGGKSVTMNFLISEIVKNRWLPYFVDFKGGVEFNIYKDKGYSVITEREDFVEFTKKLFGEVEYRSKLFADNRVKNIKAINKRFRKDGKKELPRIVAILDEYADVNAVKDDDTDTINSNIGRVLAKGRAVGVHLIIGTQRPDANTIGSGAFRDNIACRIVGKMISDSAWGMAFGTTTLQKEDKVYTNKVPDDDRFKGMFIVQGTGTITDKEIVRVPFMADEDFEKMVLTEWEDNPYEDYKLHSEKIEETLIDIEDIYNKEEKGIEEKTNEYYK